MATNDAGGLQDSATNRESLTERDIRALTDCMSVLPQDGDGLYTVIGENGGGEYFVDARDGACSCPDHQYRSVRCKHIRRTRFATGERTIPAWVEPQAVDAQLGAHVDGTPRQAATDGGVQATGDDAELLETDAEWQGPFPEYDKYGDPTGDRYYRCGDCGIEVHEDIPREDVDSHRDGCEMEA